jgi:hypothetical protein
LEFDILPSIGVGVVAFSVFVHYPSRATVADSRKVLGVCQGAGAKYSPSPSVADPPTSIFPGLSFFSRTARVALEGPRIDIVEVGMRFLFYCFDIAWVEQFET